MILYSSLKKAIPQPIRRLGKNAVETAMRAGLPAPLRRNPQAQLSVTLDFLLSHFGHDRPAIRYLQVGAFDGIAGDPMYPFIEKYNLRGILLEPQRDAFENLKKNYSRFGDSFTFVNAAIAPEDGTRPLYRVEEGTPGPEWLHQLASFDKDVLLKHSGMLPDLSSQLRVENVQCITFPTLFKTIGIDEVDMLQVDAEGYDAEIVRLFDVRARKPAIVQYEHQHLNKFEQENILELLIEVGYKITISSSETLAYRYSA